jgi:hypothetical protein
MKARRGMDQFIAAYNQTAHHSSEKQTIFQKHPKLNT